jgi:hypothetical protein
MGIDIATWRARIGSLAHFGPISYRVPHLSGLASHSRVTPRLACIIAVLLAISCVELNPGPQMDDILRRLDDLFKEMRDVRTSTSKIDDSVNELKRDAILPRPGGWFQYSPEHTGTDSDHAGCSIRCTLQASVAAINTAPPPAAATPPPTPPSVPALVKVVCELDLQASKKTNIVLSGIAPSLLTDADIVTNLLRDELGITANITKCTRLGKPKADGDRGTRPRLLLATLSSADTANDVLRATIKLRHSTDNYTRDNIFINRDLTPEQRVFDYELRKDLKRRRAAGEQNLVIHNGKVCKKQVRPAAAPTGRSTTCEPAQPRR